MSRFMTTVAGLSAVALIAGVVAGSNLVTTIDSGTVGVKKSFSGVIQPDYLTLVGIQFFSMMFTKSQQKKFLLN